MKNIVKFFLVINLSIPNFRRLLWTMPESIVIFISLCFILFNVDFHAITANQPAKANPFKSDSFICRVKSKNLSEAYQDTNINDNNLVLKVLGSYAESDKLNSLKPSFLLVQNYFLSVFVLRMIRD